MNRESPFYMATAYAIRDVGTKTRLTCRYFSKKDAIEKLYEMLRRGQHDVELYRTKMSRSIRCHPKF